MREIARRAAVSAYEMTGVVIVIAMWIAWWVILP